VEIRGGLGEIRGGLGGNKGGGVGHTPPPLSIRLYGAGVKAQGSEGFSTIMSFASSERSLAIFATGSAPLWSTT